MLKEKMESMKSFACTKVGKCSVALGALSLPVLAFAEGTPVAIPISELAGNVTEQFKMADLQTVIGLIIAAGIPFVIAWFVVRKVKSSVMAAFTKGKLKA